MEKLSAKLVSSITLEEGQTTCILPHSLTPFFLSIDFGVALPSISLSFSHPFCLSKFEQCSAKPIWEIKNE